jgi:hypothetical protein
VGLSSPLFDGPDMPTFETGINGDWDSNNSDLLWGDLFPAEQTRIVGARVDRVNIATTGIA